MKDELKVIGTTKLENLLWELVDNEGTKMLIKSTRDNKIFGSVEFSEFEYSKQNK